MKPASQTKARQRCQASAGTRLAPKPNTLQKNSKTGVGRRCSPGAPGNSVNFTTSENSKYFLDLKLKIITELNESRKERDSNEVVLRILTKPSLSLLMLLMSGTDK